MSPDLITGTDCPMKGKTGCKGMMKPIKGQKDAWRCNKCPTEIWTGDMPVWEQIHDILHSNVKEVYKSTIGGPPAKKHHKNSSGRRRKKKIVYKRRIPLDL